MTPRMKADYTSIDGLHINHFWPGTMHSDWEFGPVKIRRARIYTTPERFRDSLKEASWQIHASFGKHTIGVRWERII